MIGETLIVLAILLGGCALIHGAGLRGWGLLPLGFIAGIALLVAIGTLQAVSGLPTNPAITVTLTAALPGLWWFWRRSRDPGLRVHLPVLGLVAGSIGVLVALFRSVHLVNWHTDTFRFLLTSYLLAGDNYDAVTVNLVDKRLLAVPLLHAPARLLDEPYLRSITPLLALATLATVVWFCHRGLVPRLGRQQALAVGVVAALLLLTVNRFVFNAFYLNSHLLVAVLLLIIAGGSWLAVRDADPAPHALLWLQSVAVPALVVARAEGALLAALVLLPGAIQTGLPGRRRAAPLAVLAVSILVWHGFAATVHLDEAGSVPIAVTGLLGLGLAVALFAATVVWLPAQLQYRAISMLPWIGEATLWLAVTVFVVRDPTVFTDSVSATYENVVRSEGSWGASLLVLVGLVVYVLVFTRATDRLALRFPITTFIPLVVLLAYFREGAYRVGHGDSLNRMLIHVVPLMVLLVASGMTAERWGVGSRRGSADPAEVRAAGT